MKLFYKLINNSISFIRPPWNSPRKKTSLNLLTTFSSFKPHGNQDYDSFVPLVVQNINETIPKIAQIAEFEDTTEIVNLSIFYKKNKHNKSKQIQDKLIKNFNLRGSDKVSNNYHMIYSCIFQDTTAKYKILEIGLGTNNPNIVSSMGLNGMPGASVKAFRDTFLNSQIYGADIDKDILFSEERIETFFVNQNDLETFSNITDNVVGNFDFIIDDGLHYQLSNLNTLLFALRNLNKGGFFVIEDIGIWSLDTWKVVNKLIPTGFESQIIQFSETNFIYLVKRLN